MSKPPSRPGSPAHSTSSARSGSPTQSTSSAQSDAAFAEQDKLTAHFQSLGGRFLGNAEYKVDFFPVPEGRDSRNYRFTGPGGKPFIFSLYGSLLPQSQGTRINAAGNYNSGEGNFVSIFLLLHVPSSQFLRL